MNLIKCPVESCNISFEKSDFRSQVNHMDEMVDKGEPGHVELMKRRLKGL